MYNLNVLAKLMVLFHQILFSLASAAIAEAVLMQISVEQVPSLHKVAPRYSKLVTSSALWLFMLIPALLRLCCWVIFMLSSVLALVPYAIALS